MPNTDKNDPSNRPQPSTQTRTEQETAAKQSRRQAVLDAYRNLLSIEDSVRHLREDLQVTEGTEEKEFATGPRVQRGWEPLIKDSAGQDVLEQLDMRKVGMGVRRRLWVVLLAAVAFAVIGSLVSSLFLRSHQAEAVLLFQENPMVPDALGILPRSVTRETVAEMVRIPRNFEAVQQSLAIQQSPEQLSEMVDVRLRRASNLIRVVATANSPALAQNLVNSLAAVAVTDSKKRYQDAASQAQEYLKQEEELSRKRVEVLSRELAQFKSREGLIALDLDNRSQMEESTDLQESYQQSVIDYESKAVQFDNLQQETENMPDRIVSVEYEESPLKGRIANREMALLEARTRYGPDNPKVRMLEEELRQLRGAVSDQTFDETRQRVYENNFAKEQLKLELMRLKGQVKAAKQKRDALYAQLQDQGQDVKKVPQIQLQYQRLSEALSQAQDEHKETLAALRTAEGHMEAGRSDITVYQKAASTTPTSSVFARFLPTLGFLLGGAFALMFVLAVEVRDRRLRTARQLKNAYNVPHLLSVPELRRLSLRNAEEKTLFYVRNLAERFARLTSREGAQTMCFTSSGPGEGKSLLAYHFAAYHNRLGLKTAYINFDHRENPFTRRGPKPRSRVEDFLRGGANFEDLLTRGDRVDILQAGFDPGMKELLKSEAMDNFWDELKRHYEVIVVDAPGIVEDDYAVNLAGQCDVNFFVIGSSYTTKSHVDASLEELEERRIRPTGLILNRMKRAYIDDPRIQVQGRRDKWWGNNRKRRRKSEDDE